MRGGSAALDPSSHSARPGRYILSEKRGALMDLASNGITIGARNNAGISRKAINQALFENKDVILLRLAAFFCRALGQLQLANADRIIARRTSIRGSVILFIVTRSHA
eukprot:6182159-Pleurochrysis_carterae.AAC.6